MARFRLINLDIWEDEDEFLKYSDSEKVLFFYLITNKQCTESGVYKISQRNICGILEWTSEKFNKTISKLEPNVFFDKEKSIVFIKNFLKYNGQVFGNPRLIEKSIYADFKNYPSIIWDRFVKVYPKYSQSIEIQLKNNLNTYSDSDSESDSDINTTKEDITTEDCFNTEGGVGEEEKSNWRKSYLDYQLDEARGYEEILNDSLWMVEQERLKPYPGLNLKKTLERAHGYWKSEAAWKLRKRSKTKVLDWKATYANAIAQRMNQVFDDKIRSNKPKEKECFEENNGLLREL